MDNHKARGFWLLQAMSGIALVLLVGLHWIAQHYLASGGLGSYEEVMVYLKRPLSLALEIAFLVVVMAHALMGLRSIAADLGLHPRLQRSLDATLWVAGILTVLYGLELTWQIIHQ